MMELPSFHYFKLENQIKEIQFEFTSPILNWNRAQVGWVEITGKTNEISAERND